MRRMRTLGHLVTSAGAHANGQRCRWSVEADMPCRGPELRFRLRREAEGGEEVVDGEGRRRLPDGGGEGTAFLNAAIERQTVRGDGEDDDVGVWPGGRLDRPFRGFLKLSHSYVRHGARAKHAEQQR